MVLVLHLLRSFLKIFVRTSPGAFDVLKVDVLTMLTSPGAFEILCQVFQNELWRIFLLPCTKVVQVAVFFRENQFINPLKLTLKKWIVQDLLTARLLVEVWRWISSEIPQKFSSFLELWLLFLPDDDEVKNYFRETDFKLDNMFLILTPGFIQTPLWRTFDGGSPEDSMDDREVDSR